MASLGTFNFGGGSAFIDRLTDYEDRKARLTEGERSLVTAVMVGQVGDRAVRGDGSRVGCGDLDGESSARGQDFFKIGVGQIDIETATGVRIGKRQVEQIVSAAAQDVDAFYA